jgi:hypothetical protein
MTIQKYGGRGHFAHVVPPLNVHKFLSSYYAA